MMSRRSFSFSSTIWSFAAVAHLEAADEEVELTVVIEGRERDRGGRRSSC
jgi:hypothetical protein